MTRQREDLFTAFCDAPQELIDRYTADPARAVDVIIPAKHANALWKSNLYNYYAQIPIARLLIGDGGMPEEAREIAASFPRAHILDQRDRLSLGYCIRELIERVETEWFVYLHDDVCLPDGWFDAMIQHQDELDWFECERRKSLLVHYVDARQNAADRPYSGSQMGRRQAFDPFLDKIDDDYLFRNEDLVLHSLIERYGGRYGRIRDTYHCHQVVRHDGRLDPDVVGATVERVIHPEREQRTWNTQARGIIKYTDPDRKYLIWQVQNSIVKLRMHGLFDASEFVSWTSRTNPAWLPYVKAATRRTFAIRSEMKTIARSLAQIARLLFAGSTAPREDDV